jgi:hypothetical protein
MSATYTCTSHISCPETFTTFEAWKAHGETDNPNLLNFWSCEEIISRGTGQQPFCLQKFTTQEQYLAHFESVHKPAHLIDMGPPRYKTGQNYYCGFCCMVFKAGLGFDAPSGPGEGRDEFCGHVRAHFEGTHDAHGVKISGEWKFLPPVGDRADFKAVMAAWVDWMMTQQSARVDFSGPRDFYD